MEKYYMEMKKLPFMWTHKKSRKSSLMALGAMLKGLPSQLSEMENWYVSED